MESLTHRGENDVLSDATCSNSDFDMQVADVGQPFAVKPFAAPATRRPQPARGRRSRAQTASQGHYVRASIPQEPIRTLSDLALDATLRAAALRRTTTHDAGNAGLRITPTDYRRKIRETRTGNLILFVVDTSGSMTARKRMVAVKGAIFSLLLDAYQKRDRVGLIAFRGRGAELLLPPTNSVDQAERLLRRMPAGGRTPLASGLALADHLLQQQQYAGNDLLPLLVLISDGRANVNLSGGGDNAVSEARQVATGLAQRKVSALVIDCETGYLRLGLAQLLAQAMGARYLQLSELAVDLLTSVVRTHLTW
jgi:magnesium chelatase subunit D